MDEDEGRFSARGDLALGEIPEIPEFDSTVLDEGEYRACCV